MVKVWASLFVLIADSFTSQETWNNAAISSSFLYQSQVRRISLLACLHDKKFVHTSCKLEGTIDALESSQLSKLLSLDLGQRQFNVELKLNTSNHVLPGIQ